MNLEFLPGARAEFYEAATYYEGKEKGLGKRFRAEIGDVCSAISNDPLRWREREDGLEESTAPCFLTTSRTWSAAKPSWSQQWRTGVGVPIIGKTVSNCMIRHVRRLFCVAPV